MIDEFNEQSLHFTFVVFDGLEGLKALSKGN